MNTNGNGVWRTIAVIAITALLSVSVTVFAIGVDKVDRIEVKAMILEQSPYLQDKSGIDERLSSIQETLQEIKAELKEIRKK